MYLFSENGIDYDPGPFNVTIKKGEKNAILRVYIINDALYESGGDDTGEDFSLEIIRTSLKPVSGIHLGRTIKAKVTIVDDECKYATYINYLTQYVSCK